MATQLRPVTADELLNMPDDGVRRELMLVADATVDGGDGVARARGRTVRLRSSGSVQARKC